MTRNIFIATLVAAIRAVPGDGDKDWSLAVAMAT
jgi:hypothetical protein